MLGSGRWTSALPSMLKPGWSGLGCKGKYVCVRPLWWGGSVGLRACFWPYCGPHILLPTKTSLLSIQFLGISPRENHRWASPHRFMVQVVAAMALGWDIAARAPPMPVLGLCSFFLHALVINYEPLHRFLKRWIIFRLPSCQHLWPHFSLFSAFSVVFSSRRLWNCAVFYVFSSTTNHHFLPQLLGQLWDVGLGGSFFSFIFFSC